MCYRWYRKKMSERFNISTGLEYIGLLSDKIKRIYKANLDKTVKQFLLDNQKHVKHDSPMDVVSWRKDNMYVCDTTTRNTAMEKLVCIEEPILDITIKQYLLLASCYNVRFVSAQDRESRPNLTSTVDTDEKTGKKVGNSRLTGKLDLKFYLRDMEHGKKYEVAKGKDEGFDTLIVSNYEIPAGIVEIMSEMLDIKGTPSEQLSQLERIAQNEIINVPAKLAENNKAPEIFSTAVKKGSDDDIYRWRKVCSGKVPRMFQVLVYDLVQQMAYNKYVAEGKIIPEEFDKIVSQFSTKRNETIEKLIHSLEDNGNEPTISLLQECSSKYKHNAKTKLEKGIQTIDGDTIVVEGPYEGVEEDGKKIKKGQASVIKLIKGGKHQLEEIKPQPKYTYDNHDVVCAKLVLDGDKSVLLYSIHTPTTGEESHTIIQNCFTHFEKTNVDYMIIGIDANTKSKGTKEAVVEAVFNNNGKGMRTRFSYFDGQDKNNTLGQILKREQKEITSSGERTFGLQSQFGKAGGNINNYVDYIILAEKGDNMTIKVNADIQWTMGILTNENPADHAPRMVNIEIAGHKFKVLSFNVAGPNDNLLEYKTASQTREPDMQSNKSNNSNGKSKRKWFSRPKLFSKRKSGGGTLFRKKSAKTKCSRKHKGNKKHRCTMKCKHHKGRKTQRK